ncbi:MAG: DUF1080 domain-containing protein [Bacteroidota bacterium]
MTNLIRLFIPFLIFLMYCSPQAGQKESQEPETETNTQWVSLFNGQNLDGWIIKIKGYEAGDNYGNTFWVEDGILKVSYDEYDSFDQTFGGLHTAKSYTNYRLKVEYRFVGETAPGAPSWGFRDSGIQYHGQDPTSMAKDQNFPICLEYNLHGGNGIDERAVGQICANGTQVKLEGEYATDYCTPPQIERTLHGDQWVTAEIDVRGDTVSHWVNGEKILTFTEPRFNAEHELGKTFIREGDTKLRSGHISLQSNSHPIEFRRIDIMEYLED